MSSHVAEHARALRTALASFGIHIRSVFLGVTRSEAATRDVSLDGSGGPDEWSWRVEVQVQAKQ